MGVPRDEILRVAELLATKLVENEFVAYTGVFPPPPPSSLLPLSFQDADADARASTDLQAITNGDNPLSQRAFTIASYALCGFANLSSLGIQIGVLSALAPSRARTIARIAGSAMICGFIS